MNSLGEAVVTFAPATVATAIAAATDATPIQYGIVGLVLVGGMFPIVRWMMRRMDWSQKETANLTKRREDRQDLQVVALGNVVTELRLLNQNSNTLENKRTEEHRAVMDRLNEIQRSLLLNHDEEEDETV